MPVKLQEEQNYLHILNLKKIYADKYSFKKASPNIELAVTLK